MNVLNVMMVIIERILKDQMKNVMLEHQIIIVKNLMNYH